MSIVLDSWRQKFNQGIEELSREVYRLEREVEVLKDFVRSQKEQREELEAECARAMAALNRLALGAWGNREVNDLALEGLGVQIMDLKGVEIKPVVSPLGEPRGCRVCGIGFDGSSTGYVCNNPKCPSLVTFTS